MSPRAGRSVEQEQQQAQQERRPIALRVPVGSLLGVLQAEQRVLGHLSPPAKRLGLTLELRSSSRLGPLRPERETWSPAPVTDCRSEARATDLRLLI